MILFGYAKDFYYNSEGTLMVQVRVPNIHGAFELLDYNGKRPIGYVRDQDLPYYMSVLLPRDPIDGDVVMLTTRNEKSTEFIVIGLTGSSYYKGFII